jgi:hypothetical protein
MGSAKPLLSPRKRIGKDLETAVAHATQLLANAQP